MNLMPHQYIERDSGQVRTERLLGDRLVNLLYSSLRERSEVVFKALTGARFSSLLGLWNFQRRLGTRLASPRRQMMAWGVDLEECLGDPDRLDTPKKIFERQIRYWQCRPAPADPRALLSPCDARVLVGSLHQNSHLFIKDKFFSFGELLGPHKTRWLRAFGEGDFALLRLTPEKYHYNHTPVAGRVVDHYELEGDYHSCNPQAVVSMVTPYSKNKRVVTIIDSDVHGGSRLGLVAMIEVVALMVGEIVQCYSRREYKHPQAMWPGLFMEAGQPKSLFRPGSSTVVLLMQKDRVAFDRDLVANQKSGGVSSRFADGFGGPLVETEVLVRSSLGRGLDA